MDQWYTAVSVTRPRVESEIHFQKTTSSLLTCDLTFCLVSMLKTCSVRPARETMRQMQCIVHLWSRRTLERENLLVRVHYGRVGRDWSPDDIIGICQVYDDDLVCLVDLLAHANEVIRL